MQRNVYDFDKTIYRSDSSVDFFRFCALRYPLALLPALGALPTVAAMLCARADKTAAKQRVYRYLTKVPNVDAMVEAFWLTHEKKLMPWYLERRSKDDLIISASPEFLLAPICRKLQVSLLASRVDRHTGVYDGLNCHGEEKVRRFRQAYPDDEIDRFYSDSRSDAPLARIARESYRVTGARIEPFFGA